MSGFFLCKGMKVWHNEQGDLGKVLGNSLVHESFSIILYWPLSDMTIKPAIWHVLVLVTLFHWHDFEYIAPCDLPPLVYKVLCFLKMMANFNLFRFRLIQSNISKFYTTDNPSFGPILTIFNQILMILDDPNLILYFSGPCQSPLGILHLCNICNWGRWTQI